MENYILIEYGDGSSGEFYCELPCYPDEIQDTVSGIWNDQNIIGRSAPVSAYTGASYRNISFSVLLHRELSRGTSIEELLANIRRSVYPAYSSGGYVPPITTIRIGDMKVKGLMQSMTYNWQKPIIDNKYHVCNLSISINAILPYGYNGAGAGSKFFNSSLNPF